MGAGGRLKAAAGKEETSNQRYLPGTKGGWMAPSLLLSTHLFLPSPLQPACANRIQTVTQSPGSEFLEDPGWGLPGAGRKPGGRGALIKIKYPQPSHFTRGCLPEPGLSTGLQIFSN